MPVSDVGRGTGSGGAAQHNAGPSSGAAATPSGMGPGRTPQPRGPASGVRLHDLCRPIEDVGIRSLRRAIIESEFGLPVEGHPTIDVGEFRAVVRDELRDRVDELERLLGERA